MNFVDYCIATKNFSALEAVEDYTKVFGLGSSIKKLATKAKNTFMDKTGLSGLRRKYLTLNKRGGMSKSDILKGLFNKDKREKMKGILEATGKAIANRKQAVHSMQKDLEGIGGYKGLSDETKKKIKERDAAGMKALNDILSGKSSPYDKNNDHYADDIHAMQKFAGGKDAADYRDIYSKDKKGFKAIHGIDED